VQTDHVLVAGGGPVGFLTALGLAQRGIRVTLVESEPDIVNSPRAMVYHWSVLEGLDRLGVLEDAKRIGFTKQDYCHRVFRTGENIYWTLAPIADETDYPYNLHLGQNDLAQIAREHLARLPGTEMRFGTRITGLTQDAYGVNVELTDANGSETIRADWVIGCDGGGSTVREKLLKLNFFGITWPERFIATNVRFDMEAHGYARANFVLDDVYGAIIAKIDNSNLWRITVMEDASLPLDGVQERIHHFYNAYVPGIEGYELVQHSPYRMHQRCTDAMRVGRVLLAGDAAHITNPTGGLGLTSGLFDSFFLVDVMNAVINEGASHDLLDRYSNERRQAFIELASPQATRNKQRIYHAHEGTWFDRELVEIRKLATDRDAVLGQIRFTRALQSRL
jgi:2-polyprenyl-6-methoxyphenol hydroxylase-like FAD-dependent oxidoreductase